MLTVVNQQALKELGKVVPCIELLADRVLRVPGVSGFEEVEPPLVDQTGWIIASDAERRGIGLHVYESSLGKSAFRDRVERVRAAHLFAAWLAEAEASGVVVHEEMRLPPDWRVFRVVTDIGAFLCSISFPASEWIQTCRDAAGQYPVVRLRLIGWLLVPESVCEQEPIAASEIAVEIDGQGVHGRLRVSAAGHMVLESGIRETGMREAESGVWIRLDLGDVELGLDEVVGLRAGSILELEDGLPLRCYLRIGESALAEGEISVAEQRLSLTIVRMARIT